jgi:peptide/nickel transport system permease protein
MAGILVLTFVLAHLGPNDPAREFAGEGADQAQIDAARSYLGLDRPLTQQFAVYVGRVARGDLGTSYVERQPVRDVIGDRLGPTLLLTGTALALSIVVGLGFGILSARRPGGAFAGAVSTITLFAYSLPAFWMAQIAILVVAVRSGILPAAGMSDARAAFTGLDATFDVARHLVMPALVLALSEVALLVRVTRSGLLREAGQGYVLTARAKGVPPDLVLSRHALPNALLPVVTIIGSRIGFLVSGAVLVESVFGWPGLGTLLVQAAQTGDHPVILGMVLLVSLSVILANLLTDLTYAWIDPRIRVR